MKLTTVFITGYRSIRDKQKIEIDELVTVLIGANDHGKSNVLRALRTLNDEEPFVEDDRNWDLEADNLPLIEWHFQLTPAEISSLDTHYDSKQKDEQEESEEDEEVGDQRNVEVSDELEEEESHGEEKLGEHEEVKISEEMEKQSDLKKKSTETVEHEQRNLFAGRTGITVVYSRSGIGSNVAASIPGEMLTDSQVEELLRMRPRVELFEPTKQVTDRVELSQIDLPEFEFMRGIFMKGGLWESRARLFTQSGRSSRQLREGSLKLTNVLREEWEQGKELEWIFEHGGTNGSVINLRIQDPSVTTSFVNPSQRSSGFTSFFILSLTVFARTSFHPQESFIYLFDEPGTQLHPLAQVNLQRVFESLADRAQIIYATHSIFLVNKNVPTRNRVIRKTSEGTVIDRKPFAGNWKAVRESLGIFLSHNFLIADKTLLVEGPSDAIYVLVILHYLIRSGATNIDLNAFSIEDAGNRRNMVAMTKLMLDEGRNVVVLVDGDSHGESVYSELKKVAPDYLKNGMLSCVGLSDKQSIENILPRPDLWFEAVALASQRLINDEVRELINGENDLKKIVKAFQQEAKKEKKKTLGRLLGEKSSGWFKVCEPISKLTVAIAYEDLMREQRASDDYPIEKDLIELHDMIVKELKLPNRKAERQIIDSGNA